MKLNKLVVSMGLATAVLTGCGGSSSDDSFTVTAIDGYIVDGQITTDCSFDDTAGHTFTGTTDELGQASIDPTAEGITYLPSECTSMVEGDENTYDLDDGEGSKGAWKGKKMKSLPGVKVITPFTDTAALISETDGALSNDELKERVLVIMGYDPDHEYKDTLFEDFGANAGTGDSEGNAKVALLAQSVFDVKVQLEEALEDAGDEDNSAKDLLGALTDVLPQVTEVVEEKVTAAKEAGNNLQDLKVTVDLDLPEVEVGDDFDLKDFLNDIKDIQVDIIITTDDTVTGGESGVDGSNYGMNQS